MASLFSPRVGKTFSELVRFAHNWNDGLRLIDPAAGGGECDDGLITCRIPETFNERGYPLSSLKFKFLTIFEKLRNSNNNYHKYSYY